MKMNKYILGVFVAIFVVVISYVGYFYFGLEREFSDSPEEWSGFGDYFGGLLNPLLSFVALVLLIKSLEAQRKANDCLINQIDNSEQSEKLRKFENLFFNLVSSQREIYKDLKLNVKIHHKKYEFSAEKALLIIETHIAALSSENSEDSICSYINEIDENDNIYSLLRAFSLIVRLVSEKLSNENDFNFEDRKNYFITLINLTDFNHLRIIIIGIKYLNCYPSNCLKEHQEFKLIMVELGFDLDEYLN